MKKKLPTGSVTFLFTDIEGSTRLWERHPDAMKKSLARHDEVLRTAIEKRGGHVFKTVGDAFCAVFQEPGSAGEAAMDAQISLTREPWKETGPIRVRMGLHTGTTHERDGDYFGPAVNRVARLMALGHGEQILVSSKTADALRGTLPPEIQLGDHGTIRLKDLDESEHVFGLLIPGLRADFPPLHSLDDVSNNLPAQLSDFIGRDRERSEVTALLTQARLVTLTGAGGSGKTRLALRVAAEMLHRFPDGVWFVDLAPVTNPDLVPQVVAGAAELTEDPRRPTAQVLADHFRKRRVLFVVDNCEHLVEPVARLSEALLQACPDLRLLVTSREALGVPGESAWRIPSLSLPPAGTGDAGLAEKSEAVRLFVRRAASIQAAFALDALNAGAIVEICRRLDGIPLAIELAAARVAALSVQEIASRLSDRFRLLTGGSRTALARQQTLRATVDWSWTLLSPPERVLMRRLAVFDGGWTLSAVEAVCSGPDATNVEVPQAAVLDLLTGLVNKSIAHVEPSGRYGWLETLRQYARDRLLESEEGDRLRERHLAHFLGFAENAAAQMIGPGEALWLGQLAEDHGNLRAALEWAENDVEARMRLGFALAWFWQSRFFHREGRAWVDRALAMQGAKDAPNLLRARVLFASGALAWAAGDLSAGLPALEESVRLLRSCDSPADLAMTLSILGHLKVFAGDLESGRSIAAEGVEIARASGDRFGLGRCLATMGDADRYAGRPEPAEAAYLEALAAFRALGAEQGTAFILLSLSGLSFQRGNREEGTARMKEALARFFNLRHTGGILMTITQVVEMSASARPGDAASLTGIVESLLEDTGTTLPRPILEAIAAKSGQLRQVLGDGFEDAFHRFKSPTLDRAVTECDRVLDSLGAA